ncbi:MAG: hypothetical protein M3469_09215 [Actinomycetota bacterium]|jgi:hypothetical protein|nr:hypothetical protein [Actinomycetota bacterium]
MTSTELTNRPYADRQRVVVLPDAVIDAIGLGIEPQEGALQRAVRAARNLWDNVPRRRPSDPGSDPAVAVLEDLGEDDVNVLPISHRQASALQMPVGHPLLRTVYIGSPALPERYYPAADFHRRVFEHKFAEASLLVMALGATRLTVIWERGWNRELAGDLEAPFRKIIKASGEVKATRSQDASLVFEAELTPGDPHVPDRLVWFYHEPTWEMIANGRLHSGLREFSLTVRNSDDYGVDSDLAAKLRRRKILSLGGDFVAHRETSWRIEGEFGPAPKRSWARR